MSTTIHGHNYSKIFILVFTIAFGVIALAVGYVAMQGGTELRSRASEQRNGLTTFQDVPVNSYAFSAIERIYSLGLTGGCSSNPLKFCPSEPVTRASAAVFMVRALHGRDFVPEKATTPIFADVVSDDPMRGFMEQLYRDGVTSGCSKSPLNYCPTKALNRAELAIFLSIAIHGKGYTPPEATGTLLSDVKKSTFAASYIEQLYKDGLVNTRWSNSAETALDCDGGPRSYCPQKIATRAFMAVMLERLMDRPQIFSDVPVNHWAFSSIQRIYRNGITSGCRQNPLGYCPESPVTRAQAAVMIVRANKGSSYSPKLESAPIFSDVPDGHPFRAFIEELYRDGITSGCGADTFCPDQALTRAQASVFILKTRYGKAYAPPAAVGDVFLDVPKNAQFGGFIEKFYTQDGLTAGCSISPLRFCPNAPTTRAAMAIFLDRTFKLE